MFWVYHASFSAASYRSSDAAMGGLAMRFLPNLDTPSTHFGGAEIASDVTQPMSTTSSRILPTRTRVCGDCNA